MDIKTFSSRLFLMVVASALVAGCARPTGDFGRAKNRLNPTHSWLLPIAGHASAKFLRGEMISRLNYTEDEAELRTRAWALVLPPRHEQWLGKIEAELQRHRVLSPIRRHVKVNSYHIRLRRASLASSDARWNRLAIDAMSDAHLIDPFYTAAAKVVRKDRPRLRQLERMDRAGKISAFDHEDVMGRAEENDEVISWVLNSVEFRYSAYYHAYQRLRIEEPADNGKVENAVLHALARLHAAIGAARADLNYSTVGSRTSNSTSAVYK